MIWKHSKWSYFFLPLPFLLPNIDFLPVTDCFPVFAVCEIEEGRPKYDDERPETSALLLDTFLSIDRPRASRPR